MSLIDNISVERITFLTIDNIIIGKIRRVYLYALRHTDCMLTDDGTRVPLSFRGHLSYDRRINFGDVKAIIPGHLQTFL